MWVQQTTGKELWGNWRFWKLGILGAFSELGSGNVTMG
jgi:hypothetical protein